MDIITICKDKLPNYEEKVRSAQGFAKGIATFTTNPQASLLVSFHVLFGLYIGVKRIGIFLL